jgi:hypothetical protein
MPLSPVDPGRNFGRTPDRPRWVGPGRVCDDARVEQAWDDPVLERRRRIARLVQVGQRSGYGLFGLAIVLFVIGLFAGFGGIVGSGIVAALVVGSIVLAPAIVFGYAVRAAEREDREQGRPTMGDRAAD